MRWLLPDGQVVLIDRPFTLDGIQYPANWMRSLTEQERADRGYQILPEPQDHDGRYYSSDGSYNSLEDILRSKAEQLASIRFQKETAGVGGFRTDRESQALLTGAALAAVLDSNYTIDWKGENGWVSLNAQQLLAAAQVVRAHVQSRFLIEKQKYEEMESITDPQELIDYDLNEGW